MDREVREVVDAARGDQGAGDDHRFRADAGQQRRDDADRDHEAGGEGKVGEAGVDRRVAEDVLHVEAEEEEHRVEAAEGEQLGDVGGGESLDPKIEKGTSGSRARRSLPTNAARMTAAAANPPIVRVAPQPTSGSLDERVDEQQHARGDEGSSGEVEAASACGRCARRRGARARRCRRALRRARSGRRSSASRGPA